jgi:hypothetical protein
MVQMDVEGSEFLVLRNCPEIFTLRAVVVLEVNSEMLEYSGTSAGEVFQLAWEQNYCIYWIDERGNFELQSSYYPVHEALHGKNHGGNYLMIPNERADYYLEIFNRVKKNSVRLAKLK